MNLLQLIQEFCRRTGLPVPASAASSGDDMVVQYIGLLNEILDDLQERKAFTVLHRECSFPTVAATDQGPIDGLAPGFVRLLDDVMFDRTTAEAIWGPVAPVEWQAKYAGLYSISSTRFRFMNGHLHLSPVEENHTIAFEYMCRLPVITASVATPKSYFTADTDTCLYPDDILLIGLRYRWKLEKGLRYAENFRDFEIKVANFMAADGGHRTITLGSRPDPAPGINIPDRSWSL